MNKQFWYFLIHGLLGKRKGAYANFYSYGEHLGDALDLTLKNTSTVGLTDCDLIEAQRLDTFENFELPKECEKISKDVFFKPGLSIYKIKKNEENYIYPTGIVKSSDDGEYDAELIKNQFVAYSKDANGIYTFLMTPDKYLIEDLFFKSFDFIPSVDSVALFIEAEWDNEESTELWINKSLTERQPIIDFLINNIPKTINNGYVSTVVCCAKGETNLVIDSHKHLKLTTKDESVFNNFGKNIMDLGYQQTQDFYSLEYGYYHWHYRPADSLDKMNFREYLTKNGFEILKNE
ncbi:MAG: hypothetical protein JW866_10350 [Ignavibacteriales bacterium]|nr:hypothetical protein [Ignavibacteriales bacterium]